MAKDVSTFLTWTASPEHDERKKNGIKVIFIGSLVTLGLFYLKAHKWTLIKTRKVAYSPRKYE
jgi:ubiquinol-cytochrome c reductase cytochrome c1 subunit